MKDNIFRLFSSNVKIRVQGRNVNNFIKRLIKNKINIVRVIPKSYKEVDLIINYNDLQKIIEYKTIYDIEITKYYGKLRLLKFIKKNIYLIFFLLIGLVMIYILSNVIFKVEVIHSNSKIIKLITDELEYYGIKKYSFAKGYKEIEKIESNILENNKDDLEWLEIVREGTKYTVRVEERIINSKIEEDKVYDIVARKNAIIKEIVAESGEKRVALETYKRKGEVIISSEITLPNNEKVLKTAKGKVIGEVWYTINIDYPYYYNEIIYTGKKKDVIVLKFLNKRISIFDFNKFKNFNKDTKIIYEDNLVPISLVKEHQYETKVINEIYTYDTAVEKGIEEAKKRLLDSNSNIKEITKVVIIKEEDLSSKVQLSLFVTCLEDITEYQEVTSRDDLMEN